MAQISTGYCQNLLVLMVIKTIHCPAYIHIVAHLREIASFLQIVKAIDAGVQKK